MLAAGLVITAVAGLGIFAVGILYLAIPRSMAGNFGLPAIPDQGATPWLRLKGVRDLTAGIVAFTVLTVAPSQVIAWVVLVFTIIPLGDAVIILRAGGSWKAALGIHGSTAALMLVGATLLFLA